MLSLFTAMAREDDAWRRFREREEETDNKEEGLSLKERRTAGAVPGPGAGGKPQPGRVITSPLDRQLEQAQTLIDQVGALLKMYVAGIERLPPTEKRKQLEAIIIQIQSAAKPTQAIQFRASTLLASYNTHRDKWDRTLRDLETGKIHRQRRA
jgi:hypothetical protein